MAQKLKFGNGTWATKEGSTLAYNDENNNYKPLPFSFERDSIATRVNKEGLIEVVGNDIPRIDFKDNAKGALLLEPQRTNNILYSNDISQTFTAQDITETQNYGVAPNGNNESTRVQTTSSTSHYWKNYSLINGSQYTASFYYKGVKGETTYLRALPTGGGSGNIKLITFNGDWQREELTFTAGSATNYIYVTDNRAGTDNTATDFEVWGAQLEQGNVASSYIPTNGSTVQRAAETANGSGNSEVFNDSEGVLFADVSALANDLTNRKLSISNGASSQRIVLSYSTVSNTLDYDVVNSTQQADISHTLTDIKLFSKVAAKYKTNDFALWVNGFEVATGSSGNAPTGLSELNFDRGFGGENFYGKTKEIGYYDTALTDAELETLTSYRSLSELVTELNLNTL